MKITLIQPRTSGTEGWCPPLGLAYLASALERKKHNVRIIDLNSLPMEDDLLVKQTHDADVIGFTSTIASEKEAIRLAELFNGCQVIFGGPQASARPQPYLEISRAIVFKGEAEISLPLYLDKLDSGYSGLDTPGIIFRGNEDEIITTPEPPLLSDLDDLLLPARHLLNMQAYNVSLKRKRATNIMSSRGCPFHCIFCYHDFLGKIYRARSASDIIDEIEFLKATYGIEAILFYDDNFTLDQKRVYEICNLIIDRSLDIQWRCFSRVTGIERDLLKKMKEAGCCEIVFGVESCSQKTLDMTQKGIKVEDSLRTLRLCEDVGIATKSYIMFGFPWETKQDFEQNLAFIDKILPHQVHPLIVVPFPGTPLEKMLLEQGINIDEDIDVEGTFIAQPSFETENFTKDDLVYYRDLAYQKVEQANIRHVISYQSPRNSE